MLETIFVTLALCQNVRPEFAPNPPQRMERRERPPMTMDIFVEMIRRGDERADVNKDGKINGKDLEIVLDRRMQRIRGVENKPQPRKGNRAKNCCGCGCKCKNK